MAAVIELKRIESASVTPGKRVIGVSEIEKMEADIEQLRAFVSGREGHRVQANVLEAVTAALHVGEVVVEAFRDSAVDDDSPKEKEEISPAQAAEILRMSRPSVMRLIEKSILPARKVGSHHRLSRSEVLEYQEVQNKERRKAIVNLVALSQEFDF